MVADVLSNTCRALNADDDKKEDSDDDEVLANMLPDARGVPCPGSPAFPPTIAFEDPFPGGQGTAVMPPLDWHTPAGRAARGANFAKETVLLRYTAVLVAFFGVHTSHQNTAVIEWSHQP